MQYEGTVYRPPSEARSLIVQVTVGCAHNTCTFCTMYKDKKFKIRPLADILADFDEAAMLYGDVYLGEIPESGASDCLRNDAGYSS